MTGLMTRKEALFCGAATATCLGHSNVSICPSRYFAPTRLLASPCKAQVSHPGNGPFTKSDQSAPIVLGSRLATRDDSCPSGAAGPFTGLHLGERHKQVTGRNHPLKSEKYMRLQFAAVTFATALLALTSSAAVALERKVQINNQTSFTIVEFYASNTGTADWQEDILGSDVLPAGGSVVINIDDGSGYCKFDFLAVFDDGDELVSSDNNVCELDEFNFTN